MACLRLKTDHESVAEAGRILREGGLVAFPTETVYGLGASLFAAHALERIFQAKGRPADNPLIIHVVGAAELEEVVASAPPAADRLAARFWPGPLTLVLPKRAEVPFAATAGLESVAVRVPDHPVARALIAAARVPIAAPSANRSGRPSATAAAHVLEDFGDRIDAVIDGGACPGGIESTVLSLLREPAEILRPGGATPEALAEVLGYLPAIARGRRESPGTRHAHYRPRIPVTTYGDAAPPDPEGAFLFLNAEPGCGVLVRRCRGIEEFAARLYSFFREAEAAGAARIYVEEPPAEGIGLALLDRIRRASSDSPAEASSRAPAD